MYFKNILYFTCNELKAENHAELYMHSSVFIYLIDVTYIFGANQQCNAKIEDAIMSLHLPTEY